MKLLMLDFLLNNAFSVTITLDLLILLGIEQSFIMCPDFIT